MFVMNVGDDEMDQKERAHRMMGFLGLAEVFCYSNLPGGTGLEEIVYDKVSEKLTVKSDGYLFGRIVSVTVYDGWNDSNPYFATIYKKLEEMCLEEAKKRAALRVLQESGMEWFG